MDVTKLRKWTYYNPNETGDASCPRISPPIGFFRPFRTQFCRPSKKEKRKKARKIPNQEIYQRSCGQKRRPFHTHTVLTSMVRYRVQRERFCRSGEIQKTGLIEESVLKHIRKSFGLYQTKMFRCVSLPGMYGLEQRVTYNLEVAQGRWRCQRACVISCEAMYWVRLKVTVLVSILVGFK